jgi:hypothetical protein
MDLDWKVHVVVQQMKANSFQAYTYIKNFAEFAGRGLMHLILIRKCLYEFTRFYALTNLLLSGNYMWYHLL